RYASAEAMIEALTLARGLLSERDMEATILLRPSAGTHQRRHRRWIAVGAVTVVVAGGVTAVRLAQPRSTAGRSAGSATAAAATRWQTARTQAQQKPVPPVGVRQAAEGTASRLAQAVASRDVEAIRRVYPNLASDEQDRWVQFFQTTESVTASLHVDSLEAQG